MSTSAFPPPDAPGPAAPSGTGEATGGVPVAVEPRVHVGWIEREGFEQARRDPGVRELLREAEG